MSLWLTYNPFVFLMLFDFSVDILPVNLGGSLYLFLMSTVTNDCKLGGLTQHKFIIFSCGVQKSKMGLS